MRDDAARIRTLVYTTLFGSLWGVLEMFLGGYLHMIQFPLRGALLAAIGSVLLCAARLRVDRPGATLAAGAVAAAVRLSAIGGFKLGPIVGIGIEAALLEAVLTGFGCGRPQFLAGCALACLEGIPHFFVTNWLFFGRGIFATYLEVVEKMQGFFGLPPGLWKAVVAVWAAAHLVLGLAAGAAAAALVRRPARAK
jgi:hypothetical protein